MTASDSSKSGLPPKAAAPLRNHRCPKPAPLDRDGAGGTAAWEANSIPTENTKPNRRARKLPCWAFPDSAAILFAFDEPLFRTFGGGRPPVPPSLHCDGDFRSGPDSFARLLHAEGDCHVSAVQQRGHSGGVPVCDMISIPFRNVQPPFASHGKERLPPENCRSCSLKSAGFFVIMPVCRGALHRQFICTFLS